MTTTTNPLDALLKIRDGDITARWNFPDAIGTSYSSPGGIGNAVTLSYSFLNQAPVYYPVNGFVAFSALQSQATQNVLTSFSSVTNLSFTEITGVGDVTFAMKSEIPSGDASTFLPTFGSSYYIGSGLIASVTASDMGGDVWFDSTRNWTSDDFAAGHIGYGALVHEIAHALGLKHPFEATANGSFLDASLDNKQYTVMSYTDHPSHLYRTVTEISPGVYSSDSFKWVNITPETLMPLDIQALQYLYGVNTSFNAGDNTYTFDTTRPFIKTIWDGGGNDTISIANFTIGSTINLKDGNYSSIRILSDAVPLGWSDPNTGIYDGTDNLAIAYGAIIENATGGSGNDTLIGNPVDNILNGGGGNDTAVFGSWITSTVTGNSANATVIDTTGVNGTDTLISIEYLTFSNRSPTPVKFARNLKLHENTPEEI